MYLDPKGSYVDDPFRSQDTIRIPKEYRWNPQEDITVYELALCLPLILFLCRRGIE